MFGFCIKFVEDNPPGELLGTDLEFNSSTYYGFEIENVKNAEDNPKTLSDSKKILEKVINHFFEVQEGDVYIDYVEIRERARTTKTQKKRRRWRYCRNVSDGNVLY